MNIKSLLLGSAAALAVVSGAQAADAIVAAEPEPMEYVRVCDAFGTGYFYIPGTETCLKVGGRVRFDVQAADSYSPNSDNGWNTRSRAELYLDSASDTEYGALKTQIIARWDFDGDYNDGQHTTTKLIAANITLAGFLVGLADSQYSSFTNYAGDIINDDVVYYGPFETNQITYNYDGGNGFKAVISLEDDSTDDDDYMVDVVGGIGYSTGTFGFTVVGGYDQSVEEGAVKARLDGTFGAFSAFVMGGWNSDGDKLNKYASSNFGGAASGIGWGDWAVWGGLGYSFSDTLAANLQLAYTDSEVFAAAANVKWNPVPGLLIQPEVTYTNWDSIDEDQWNGMVRFQRTF